MRIATFAIDITPPVGHPLAYCMNRRIAGRQWLRGVALDDGRRRTVLAAADVLAIGGAAHALWRRVIGKATGCPADAVLLHAVHQHDALVILPEVDAERRMAGWDDGADPAWWRHLARTIAAGLAEQMTASSWRTALVCTAETRVRGVAANRRLLSRDGTVRATRWSMCKDPALQREPVGLIDPLLRTIAFRSPGGRILATCHFYGCHPQVAYQREMAGPDLPGSALGRLKQSHPGMHLWFTGCGGDVTAGKYTDPDPECSLATLGQRLATAMSRNLDHLDDHGSGRLAVRRVRVSLPMAAPQGVKGLRRRLVDGPKPLNFMPALLLALWRRRVAWGRPVLTRLELAPGVQVLSLPSEIMVHYQLFAQAQAPEEFVACAALGDYLHGYIPTDRMFAEGGYEPGASLCVPGVQAALEAGLRELVQGTSARSVATTRGATAVSTPRSAIRRSNGRNGKG
jgi:hypothetical protein